MNRRTTNRPGGGVRSIRFPEASVSESCRAKRGVSSWRARRDLEEIVAAVRDWSGSMSCAEWEKTYPQFRKMSGDDLGRELSLRLAQLILAEH
jgi:hypothetical protein